MGAKHSDDSPKDSVAELTLDTSNGSITVEHDGSDDAVEDDGDEDDDQEDDDEKLIKEITK